MIPQQVAQQTQQQIVKEGNNSRYFQHQLNNVNQDINRDDDFKYQYSTFIQELEQTTQKLMNQVFNHQYKLDAGRLFDGDFGKKGKNGKSNTNFQKNNTSKKQISQKNSNKLQGVLKEGSVSKNHKFLSEISPTFKNFLVRNNKWLERRQQYIRNEKYKRQKQQLKQIKIARKIYKNSIQNIQPIYERARELNEQKQKRLQLKRIQHKKKQEEQIKKIPFHPQIRQKNRMRTLEQYLTDKEIWQKKKRQTIEINKLKYQAQKYYQCTFKPNLISKQIQQCILKSKPNQKVQERLLRSLQKVYH